MLKKIALSAILLNSLFSVVTYSGSPCIANLSDHVYGDLLFLQQCDLHDEDAQAIATFLDTRTDIDALSMGWNSMGAAGAAIIAKTHYLKMLEMGLNPIGDGAAAFANNSSIKTFYLNGDNIGDVGAEGLAKNTTATDLELIQNPITDEGAAAFGGNSSLQILNLRKAKLITDKTAIALSKNTTLTTIDLGTPDSAGVTDVGAIALGTMPKLHSINLENHKVTDNGVIALAKQGILYSANFNNNNNITDAGALALAANKSLSSVCLSSNQITDQGAIALSQLQYLDHLELSNNNITDAAASAIAKMTYLEEIYLEKNQLTDEGVSAIMAKNPNNIKTFYIGYNQLSDNSAWLFNCSGPLKNLSIPYSHLTKDGVARLWSLTCWNYLDTSGNDQTKIKTEKAAQFGFFQKEFLQTACDTKHPKFAFCSNAKFKKLMKLSEITR